jgi:antitoxin MazE
MKIAIRRIGNSRGMIIPTAILNQLGLEEEADVTVKDGALVIRPPRKEVRAGWAEASKTLSAAGEDKLTLPEFCNAGDADLQW